MIVKCFSLFAALFSVSSVKGSLENLDVPLEHLAIWSSLNETLQDLCLQNGTCKETLKKDLCWGYEKTCTPARRFHKISCDGPDGGWTKRGTRAEQEEQFFETADFGYIRKRIEENQMICRGSRKGDSVVECVDHARLCRLENVFLDFRNLKSVKPPVKYSEKILSAGLIGGKCRLNVEKLKQLGQHESALQSWFAEIKHFTVIESQMHESEQCSVTIEEPTMIVKLDATVNMYHHFCDFVNLYATLHFLGDVSTDVNVIIWDNIPYRSNFLPMWKTITKKPLRHIGEFKEKGRICFKKLVMPFPPRMIFGLYYNMPLIPGCHGSGLMKAFREHTLHRLGIIVNPPDLERIRVTFISRSTSSRRILNEKELVDALNDLPNVEAKLVDFNFRMEFLEQIKISANTDVLIGMHGAGLTHSIFLPEGAAVFEVFNCGDPGCYSDLSRLVGKRYFTWEKPSKMKAVPNEDEKRYAGHEKFANYVFNKEEFLSISRKAIEHVRGTLKAPVIHDEM